MIRAKVYGLIGVLMGLLGGIQARAEATVAYYHTDHLGSVRMITDSQGAVISVHDYFPYGEDTTPTPNNRLKFTGQLRDQESGLDYFGARYYGSVLGRFVSSDAVRNDSHPGNPQSWNRYAYGRNNPLRFIDPTGEAVVAYDANGNLLCKDLDCNFYKKGNLTVGDRTYAPNQYTVEDPNPSVTITAKSGSAGQLAEVILWDTIATIRNDFLAPFNWATQKAFGFVPSYSKDAPTYGTVGETIGVVAGFALPGPGGKAKLGGRLISPAARKKLGNLANRVGEKVRDVIRSRGGTASNVNQAGHWADKTLGEAAQAAAKGDPTAETAIKIAKEAGRLGQQY
ncbi:MAG: hypothetical protein HY232_19245 [Acidobacteria bacterium]|nr:hypothetical protein [Acidobacteriota bacterium]